MQIGNYLPGFSPSTAKITRQRTAQANQRTSFHSNKVLKLPNVTEDTLYAQTVGDEQSVHIQLTKDTTEENPVLRITVRYYDKEYDFTRNVKEIDPQNATYAEMCALASWENKIGNLPIYKGALRVVPVGMEIGDVMQKQNFAARCSSYIASGKFGPNITAQAKDMLGFYQKVIANGNFSNYDTKDSTASRRAMDEALQELMDALETHDFTANNMTAYSAYRRVADDALMDLIKLA